VDDKLNIIISELKNLSGKVDNMESSLKNLDGRVKNMEHEVKEFRGEVQTDLKVIKGGQTGLRNELTDRFNEIKTSLRHIESDIEHTYLKTAQNELELRRLKRQ
jgi:uncharacterized alpha-E superfamily protein